MVDEKRAADLAAEYAKKKNWKCSLAEETEHFYVFLSTTLDNELIYNSSSITVDKTSGKVDMKHFSELVDERVVKEY